MREKIKMKLILEGLSQNYKISQELVPTKIGRSNDCEIQVKSEFYLDVSKLHCGIYFNGKEFPRVMDYYSKCGTYINGEQIAPNKKVSLKHDYKLRLGQACEFRVCIPSMKNLWGWLR